VKANKTNFKISTLCQVFGISRSGYYEWLNQKPSVRKLEAERLKNIIHTAYQMSRRVYGYRRVHAEMRAQNISCSLNRVSRLMKQEGLKSKTRRKFRITTDSTHTLPVYPNLLERNFIAKKPNMSWTSDITFVATQEGWLYLAVILDLYSRKVVGWAMDSRMTTELIKRALNMAYRHRSPNTKTHLIIHSDRGSQYASASYQALLKQYGLIVSMSRKGDCWDNAVTESFFATLKRELIYHEKYVTRAEASSSIFEFIEVFYNRQRRHSTLGYISPEEYERIALAS
jgi:transposase InsO family protein